VYFGRSLIYRDAAVAPLFLPALMGLESELKPGQIRRMASGAAQYVLNNGAYAEGLASLGWMGAFEPMTQTYSGPASPYWSSKAFVALLLPADHPVWTATEEPGPVEVADRLRKSSGPNFLLAATAHDGIARVLNHGSDDYFGPGEENIEYSRFAYSSHTAPLYSPDGPVDNHIAVMSTNGEPSRRLRIHRLPAAPGSVASYHHPVWGTDDEADSPWTVATATTAGGGFEVRLHVVLSRTGQSAQIREGGYALADSVQVAGAHGDGRATVSSPALWSSIWSLAGYGASGIYASDGHSPVGWLAAVGFLTGAHQGRRSVHASLVNLSATPPAAHPVSADLVDRAGSVAVTVRLSDGRELQAELMVPQA
jgi:hypothetical protein